MKGGNGGVPENYLSLRSSLDSKCETAAEQAVKAKAVYKSPIGLVVSFRRAWLILRI